jgi:hypothetical protein
VLRAFDHPGALCVAFNIPAENEKVVVILDGKALESSLVNMSFAGSVVVEMIPHRMRQGDPTQETAHPSILGRLQHKVPMVWHQLIGKNAAWIASKPLGKNVFERFVITVLVKNDRAAIASIQGMVDRILLVGEFGAGHPLRLTALNLAVKSPDPFF